MTTMKALKELTQELRLGFLGINNKLDVILAYVRDIRQKETHVMKEFDDLKVVVTNTEGEVESLNVAVDTIVATVAEILGQIKNSVDPAEVTALTEKATQYLAAIAANRAELETAVQSVPA